jgi:peptidoglycan hydrolase-like protein with peptidoglycan-binding domain
MISKILLTAAGAAVSYFGWKKLKKPTAGDYQSVNVIGQNGVPIKVSTPVPKTVTRAQSTATSSAPPAKQIPVPTTVSGKGVVYAPPNTVQVNSQGEVLQPPPIVISPAGASSLGVGTLKDVQHALNTLGFSKPPLVEDGKLGPKTSNCIRAFQKAYHLQVDGNAGPATKQALSDALTKMAGGNSPIGAAVQSGNPASGKVTVRPVVKPVYSTLSQTELGPYDTAPNRAGLTVNTTSALGMTNSQVQHALNLTGASPKLQEDGNLGPKSVAAIKSFQAAHGLIPDGVAGAKTKTALYLASSQATH